jgi:hypothetical protein
MAFFKNTNSGKLESGGLTPGSVQFRKLEVGMAVRNGWVKLNRT